MSQKFLILLLGLGLVATSTAMAQTPPAATYYVATTGSDKNNGTSPTTPFLTITHALTLCTGGQTVAVASGTYMDPVTNTVTDSKTNRTSMCTVFGWGTPQPVIEANTTANPRNQAWVENGNDVTFENFTIRSTAVQLQTVAIVNATNIMMENCDIEDNATNNATYAGVCVVLCGSGNNNVTIEDCNVHDSGSGICCGAPLAIEANNIHILDNMVTNMTGDAMQFGYWNNVTISGNELGPVADPAHVYHNDGIQFTGNCNNITISNNIIRDIADQGMLLQAAFAPNTNILVENNLIYGIGGVAVQNGSNQIAFINNTIVDNGLGGLLMRAGYSGAVLTDGVVANNVLQSYGYLQGAEAVYEDYNYLPKGQGTGVHDIFGTNPDFVNTADFDFQLASGSPLFGKGVHSFSATVDGVLTNFTAPATDLLGVPRGNPPTMGAYELFNYAAWCAEYNLTGTNALQTTVLDGDGLNNLYKYALGLQPMTPYSPGASGLPSVQTANVLGTNYLTLTFDGVATDVTYQVQATSDLTGSWTTIKTFSSGSTAPGMQTVQDTQAIGGTPQRYMRLLMTLSD